MKKIFYFMSLFLGLLVCSSAFVACGDDDDSSSDSGKYAGNRIVGTWQWGDPEMSSEEHHHHIWAISSRPMATVRATWFSKKRKSRGVSTAMAPTLLMASSW